MATTPPDFSLEQQIGGQIAAIDEVGRGPWAGPVVAVAVILPQTGLPDGITDSKQLSRARREALYEVLIQLQQQRQLHYGIGWQSPAEIDQHNILEATHRAMQRAYTALSECCPSPIDHVLVDGNRLPELPVPATPVIKGDSRSLSIAAASIIAKVVRDRHMAELAERFPFYGWERNAGYGTREHQVGLASHGVSEAHRKSFAPIRLLLQQNAEVRSYG